ncbi:MaoC/PaaZ C-terminal domain-containing protein [Pontibacillus yanchengensis]|uniref:MaoC/PaaZ C-terminal domain-containing protein n=1 Tax=Pontibacillus yanchengensis TaxID=462910 RepID=UPI00055AAC05|nr:MaoC/PaaZ C-terminal domain-containing protein [Pontibacillus yanchengensis]
MLLGKKRKLGKKMKDIQVGETYSTNAKIEDKDLLLFLGLTDDANPLYIQHDYASQTPFKRPIVPTVMLNGIVTSAISMHLPGPGCHIVEEHLHYPNPVHHYAELDVSLEVTEIDQEKHLVTVKVIALDEEGKEVIKGTLNVCPAYEPESMNAISLENFY